MASSAREIVVAHGGSIACHSVLGEGSEFYFLLSR
jgi:signal transduction histidine kinase